MRPVAIALAGAAASALYWWLVATVAFALVGGDPGPAAAPRSDGAQQALTAVVLAAAITLHAGTALLWERLTRRR